MAAKDTIRNTRNLVITGLPLSLFFFGPVGMVLGVVGTLLMAAFGASGKLDEWLDGPKTRMDAGGTSTGQGASGAGNGQGTGQDDNTQSQGNGNGQDGQGQEGGSPTETKIDAPATAWQRVTNAIATPLKFIGNTFFPTATGGLTTAGTFVMGKSAFKAAGSAVGMGNPEISPWRHLVREPVQSIRDLTRLVNPSAYKAWWNTDSWAKRQVTDRHFFTNSDAAKGMKSHGESIDAALKERVSNYKAQNRTWSGRLRAVGHRIPLVNGAMQRLGGRYLGDINPASVENVAGFLGQNPDVRVNAEGIESLMQAERAIAKASKTAGHNPEQAKDFRNQCLRKLCQEPPPNTTVEGLMEVKAPDSKALVKEAVAFAKGAKAGPTVGDITGTSPSKPGPPPLPVKSPAPTPPVSPPSQPTPNGPAAGQGINGKPRDPGRTGERHGADREVLTAEGDTVKLGSKHRRGSGKGGAGKQSALASPKPSPSPTSVPAAAVAAPASTPPAVEAKPKTAAPGHAGVGLGLGLKGLGDALYALTTIDTTTEEGKKASVEALKDVGKAATLITLDAGGMVGRSFINAAEQAGTNAPKLAKFGHQASRLLTPLMIYEGGKETLHGLDENAKRLAEGKTLGVQATHDVAHGGALLVSVAGARVIPGVGQGLLIWDAGNAGGMLIGKGVNYLTGNGDRPYESLIHAMDTAQKAWEDADASTKHLATPRLTKHSPAYRGIHTASTANYEHLNQAINAIGSSLKDRKSPRAEDSRYQAATREASARLYDEAWKYADAEALKNELMARRQQLVDELEYESRVMDLKNDYAWPQEILENVNGTEKRRAEKEPGYKPHDVQYEGSQYKVPVKITQYYVKDINANNQRLDLIRNMDVALREIDENGPGWHGYRNAQAKEKALLAKIADPVEREKFGRDLKELTELRRTHAANPTPEAEKKLEAFYRQRLKEQLVKLKAAKTPEEREAFFASNRALQSKTQRVIKNGVSTLEVQNEGLSMDMANQMGLIFDAKHLQALTQTVLAEKPGTPEATFPRMADVFGIQPPCLTQGILDTAVTGERLKRNGNTLEVTLPDKAVVERKMQLKKKRALNGTYVNEETVTDLLDMVQKDTSLPEKMREALISRLQNISPLQNALNEEKKNLKESEEALQAFEGMVGKLSPRQTNSKVMGKTDGKMGGRGTRPFGASSFPMVNSNVRDKMGNRVDAEKEQQEERRIQEYHKYVELRDSSAQQRDLCKQKVETARTQAQQGKMLSAEEVAALSSIIVFTPFEEAAVSAISTTGWLQDQGVEAKLSEDRKTLMIDFDSARRYLPPETLAKLGAPEKTVVTVAENKEPVAPVTPPGKPATAPQPAR